MSTGLSATRASVLTTQATISYYTDVSSGGDSQWTFGYTQSNGQPYYGSFQPVLDSYNTLVGYYLLEGQPVQRTATKNSLKWSLPNNTTSTSSSGSVIVTGLTPGSASNFSATLYTQILGSQSGTSYQVYMYDENQQYLGTYNSSYGSIFISELNTYAVDTTWQDWTYWSYPPVESSYQPDGTSYSITVYTRPGNFTEFDSFSGGENGTVIESAAGLTVGKVNRWKDHCNKFAHWWNQDGNDVTGNIPQVNAGDLIKASWYNACVAACANSATRPQNVTANVTYITPKVFSDLGAAISADDNTSVS